MTEDRIYINIDIKDKIATAPEDAFIVCENSNYSLRFNFDKEWEYLVTKTARFYYNFHYVDVIFDGVVCDVPVLEETSLVKIGVFAGDIKTTTPAEIKCVYSIKKYGGRVKEPKEDVYHQIIALLEKAIGGGSGVTIQVDTELLIDSENPVQNKVITRKIYEIGEKIPIVDEAFIVGSKNAVQSKVIKGEIDKKVEKQTAKQVGLAGNYSLYGIYYDGLGNPKEQLVSTASFPIAGKIPKWTATGTLQTEAPTNLFDAVNLGYFLEHSGGGGGSSILYNHHFALFNFDNGDKVTFSILNKNSEKFTLSTLKTYLKDLSVGFFSQAQSCLQASGLVTIDGKKQPIFGVAVNNENLCAIYGLNYESFSSIEYFMFNECVEEI